MWWKGLLFKTLSTAFVKNEFLLVKRKGRLVAVLLYGSFGQVHEDIGMNYLTKR